MEDDIGDIEREQFIPETTKGSTEPTNPSVGRRIPLPRVEQIIERLWAEGKSPEEIAREVGEHVSTIYPSLKRLQKRIIEQGGVELM